MEQKIDGLVASLESQPKHASAETPISKPDSWKHGTHAPGSWMHLPTSFEPSEPDPEIDQAPSHAEADREYLAKIQSIHNFGDRADVAATPGGLFRPSKSREAPIDDASVQRMLASGEAETLVDEYRNMSVSFPFVVLPAGLSANELHESRPMLFLAILTVASWKIHRRQMLLDKIYRTELAKRTIIQPRRTLGLVQSVLVYLSG